MDVTRKDDGAVLSCAACGHTFDLGYAADPAKELSRIALGAYLYCPRCGAAYEGCRIDGVPFEECGQEVGPCCRTAVSRLFLPKKTN